MIYLLAERWRCPVPVLRKIMTDNDLMEAVAYYDIYPTEAMEHTALIAAEIYNSAPRGKHDKGRRPSDYIPQYKPRKPSADELGMKLKAWFASHNAKVAAKSSP